MLGSVQKHKGIIRSDRLKKWSQVQCSNFGIAVPWPKHRANVGTTLRLADAVDACLYLPAGRVAEEALARGNTIGDDAVHARVHWTDDDVWFLAWDRLVCVELALGSTLLVDLEPIRPDESTLMMVGHETHGIPNRVLAVAHDVVEIPMLGVGASLNVGHAAALAAYKLRGLI